MATIKQVIELYDLKFIRITQKGDEDYTVRMNGKNGEHSKFTIDAETQAEVIEKLMERGNDG